MKCEMNGRAGRIVVTFADVAGKLRRGYEFATAAEKAKYEESLRPKQAAAAVAPEPTFPTRVEGEFVEVDSDDDSDDEPGI